MQLDKSKNDEDELLAMIDKGFKKMFQKHPNSREFGKDRLQGGMNENPKVSFSQEMILVKISVMVVEFQVT